MILMPNFQEIYPGYACTRAFVQISAIVVVTVPFAPDYVKDESIGLAIGYG